MSDEKGIEPFWSLRLDNPASQKKRAAIAVKALLSIVKMGVTVLRNGVKTTVPHEEYSDLSLFSFRRLLFASPHSCSCLIPCIVPQQVRGH
jgi:hypothetical protein